MKLLEIKNLHTYFSTSRGYIKGSRGVSLTLDEGRTLGLVGESGSGKSVTAMSIVKLFETNQKIHHGEIYFQGKKISGYSERQLRKIRGNDISIIFQEPMTSLNPVHRVKRQIMEVLRLHQKLTKEEAYKQTIQLLKDVGIANPEKTADVYAFQLSGGMSQRVMIAMALACNPKLLIADEPTTALDVTIQAQILDLMRGLKEKYKTSIIFVTHDLGVIREMADDVAVMYAGAVVETAPVETIFGKNPKFSHPYTQALFRSIPRLTVKKSDRLAAIEGSVPHPLQLPEGCKFAPRCAFATEKCRGVEPELVQVDKNHFIRCYYPQTEVRNNEEQ